MPIVPGQITLGQATANRAHLCHHTPEGDLNVWYRPLRLTPRQQHMALRLQALDPERATPQEAMEANESVMALLASVLLDWDMEYPSDDGMPSGRRIPPTRAGLEDVEYDTQAAVLRLIQEHMRLGETSGTPSSAASPASRTPAKRAGSRRSAAVSRTGSR